MRLAALAALALIALLFALPGGAFAIEVTASIAPVHSLVARVMQGAGAPYLLLRPGASPHDNALRPSDAAALQRAALVFWVGPRLEPWLERPLETLAGEAQVVILADTPGLIRLPVREGAVFKEHDHEPVPRGGEADTHLWLDPENAKLWLDAIAAALGRADPRNRALYLANAGDAKAELGVLTTEIYAQLTPIRERTFVVLHDAYHAFENRFGIEAAGAVAVNDARSPGPARIAEIRTYIRDLTAANATLCLFLEPQVGSAIATALAGEAGVKVGLLDPLGSELEPGATLYPRLMRAMADSFADCLS